MVFGEEEKEERRELAEKKTLPTLHRPELAGKEKTFVKEETVTLKSDWLENPSLSCPSPSEEEVSLPNNGGRDFVRGQAKNRE